MAGWAPAGVMGKYGAFSRPWSPNLVKVDSLGDGQAVSRAPKDK